MQLPSWFHLTFLFSFDRPYHPSSLFSFSSLVNRFLSRVWIMKNLGMVTCAKMQLFIFLLVLFSGWSCNGDIDSMDMATPMEREEQEALYSAIQGFVGNQWNGSDLYPDPCGWTPIQGVSCDLFNGLWYITDLNIGPINDNSLTCNKNPRFRPHLFKLKHLKSLSFFNCFNHINPTSIPSNTWGTLAHTLESLEFRLNPTLTGEIPREFGRLRKLRSLVILENGLSGHIPGSIGELYMLKRLVLSGNKFTGYIPNTIGINLHELLILDLSRNALSGTLPTKLVGLRSLLKLDLNGNRIMGSIPTQIGSLKNLTLLDLSNNSLSGGLVKSLDEMYSLEELILSGNPIGGEMKILDWGKMVNLVMLDLSNVGLTGEFPESISGLKNLRFLDLSKNYLTGEVSRKIEEGMVSLSGLYLSGNNLTGELRFSGDFYKKMGRRFEALNNSNLCYHHQVRGEDDVDDGPVGVKPCQESEETTLYGTTVQKQQNKKS